MSRRLTPISWDDLVRTLAKMGFSGPYRGMNNHCLVDIATMDKYHKANEDM